jgi:hypothetical protein
MNRLSHQKLLDLMDAYGADGSRWPADAAHQFAGLADDPAMALALRQSQAFDQVLARAGAVSATRQSALADRIMAAVHEDAVQRDAAKAPLEAGNVIALPGPRPNRFPVASPRDSQRRSGMDWRAVAALAAALVLGFGVGVSGTGSPTFEAVAESVGVNWGGSVLASNDETVGALAALDDEDML